MWVVTTADINDEEEFINNKNQDDAIKLFLKKCIDRQVFIDSAETEDEKDFYSQAKIYLCKITDIISCDDIEELTEDFAGDVQKAREKAVDSIFKKHGKTIIEKPKIWMIAPKEATKSVE